MDQNVCRVFGLVFLPKRAAKQCRGHYLPVANKVDMENADVPRIAEQVGASYHAHLSRPLSPHNPTDSTLLRTRCVHAAGGFRLHREYESTLRARERESEV